jgi:hypothetical protein
MKILLTKSQLSRIILKEDTESNTTEKLRVCKRNISDEDLKSAITRWKSWLNNQATKDRFGKTFKYDKNTVNKHFAEYNNLLGQIKMDYVFSDKPNGGWVSKLKPKIITINCRISSNMNPESVQNLLIHEIQHVLDNYHKFHPYSDNMFTFYRDIILDTLNPPSEENIKDEEVKKLLINSGIKNNLNKIIYSYKWRLKNDVEHLRDPNEIMSSLSELRLSLNIKPSQKITIEMLNDNSLNFTVIMFINQWLFSKKSLTEFLNTSNSIAMQKPNTSDTNLAYV